MSESIRAVYLLGRCANGAERDKGKLVHAVPDSGVALCGATYGSRSAGWSREEDGQMVTCPRCLRRATVTTGHGGSADR
jgi:hypothetical protein